MLTKALLIEMLEPLADTDAVYVSDITSRATVATVSVYKIGGVTFGVVAPVNTKDTEHDET